MLVKRKLYSVMDEEGNLGYYLYDESNGEERMFARGTKEAGKAAKEFLKKKSRSSSENFKNKLIDAYRNGGQHHDVAIGQRYVEGSTRAVPGRPKVAALTGGGTEVIPGSSSRVYTPGHYENVTVRPRELATPIKGFEDAKINSLRRDIRAAGHKLKDGEYDHFDLSTKTSNLKDNLANAYIKTSNEFRSRRKESQGIDLLKIREKLKGQSFYANGKYGKHPYLTQKELLKVVENERRDPYSSIKKFI